MWLCLNPKQSESIKIICLFETYSSGHIRFETRYYEVWGNDLGLSTRTIRTSLAWLIKNKWITVNNKKNGLRIISYFQLCRKLKVNEKNAVKYDSDDFIKFKGFCCAAMITFYIRKKTWIALKRRSGSKMDDSNTSRKKCPKGFSTLPVRYFATCMKITPSSANKYKRAAIEAGYILAKRQITTIKDEVDKKLEWQKGIVFAKVNSEIAGRLRQGKKYLKIVDADLLKSYVQAKSKRYKYDEKK
jgi:hypothetical protein